MQPRDKAESTAGDQVAAAGERSSGARTLTLVLSGTPYGTDRAAQALRLARAALARGHRANLFVSADGTYAVLSDQVSKGLPEVATELAELIERGLRVELCGSCLRYRGLTEERLVPGTLPSTLRGLGAMLREADAVVCL